VVAVVSSTAVDWSDVLSVAVDEVAKLGPAGAGNESLLHRRLRDALRRAGIVRVLETEGRLQDQEMWWTRAPGGIDVVATRGSGGQEYALGVECKISKPDELLWDAIKLGQRCGDNPWKHGLEAGALVVEVKSFDELRATSWFDRSVTEVDVVEVIAQWPGAWYGLMCGGRGIRPTSLPQTLTLGAGGAVRHPSVRSALCWRLVATTSAVDDDDRVVVDAHGWPPQVLISDEWRRQIDIAAERSPGPPRITPRQRGVLASPPGSLVVKLVRDEDGRLWADAWDSRETVPTSFRLVESEPKRYDVMRAKNNALRFADPSRPLPGWCAWAVADAIARL
jgi:hypothetical protein